MVDSKPRAYSAVETVQLMMPSNSNPAWTGGQLELGAVNGGAILNLIDNIAGLSALRHCRTRVVTASIDQMSFLNPVHVGELLILKATVNYVGRTSLEVGVRIETEDLTTGQRKVTGNAYLTFVCLDDSGKPKIAPNLLIETIEDQKHWEQAKIRLEHRRELIKKKQASKYFD